MNKLEWIDKQILLVKENIQYHKDLLAEAEEEYTDEIISAIKLLEPELQTLQQIKTILESREVIYYILFEQAEDGYYGDFVIGNKLYSEDEAKTYIQIHAQRIYDEENGVECYFKAESTNTYGEGVFYFRGFKTNEKNLF